ncbi:unnamed protein product, partial [Amoebophrya sp. A120]
PPPAGAAPDVIEKFGRKVLFGEIYEKTALQYHCEAVDDLCFKLLYDIQFDVYAKGVVAGDTFYLRDVAKMKDQEEDDEETSKSAGAKTNDVVEVVDAWYMRAEVNALERKRKERLARRHGDTEQGYRFDEKLDGNRADTNGDDEVSTGNIFNQTNT